MTLIGLKNVVWLASLSVFELFDSMYETFNALTAINPQHFVEWFSGSVLDSIWTLGDEIGSGTTGAMSDEIDGGYAITPPGVLDAGAITFNDKHQFAHDESVCIAVCQKIDVGGRYRVGLGDSGNLTSTADSAHAADGAVNFINLETADGSTLSDTASTVAANTTNRHDFKIELGSANIKLTIDGILEVTKTTNRPTIKLQPVFFVRGGGGAGNQKCRITFMECFNTDVSILSSLHDRLTSGASETTTSYDHIGDTQDNFLDVWLDHPYAIIKITTGSAAIDTWIQKVKMSLSKSGTPTGSAFIRIWDENDVVVSEFEFAPDTFLDGTETIYEFQLSNPIKLLLDYKIGLFYDVSPSSPNRINAFIDTVTIESGYLAGFTTLNDDATTRNQLMTFDSSPGIVPLRQRVVETFSGAVLNERWTVTQIVATITATMQDIIDGGVLLATDAGAGSPSGTMTFNNKRQYDPTNCKMITTCKKQDDNIGIKIGFTNDTTVGPSHQALLVEGTLVSFKSLTTKDGTTESTTATSLALSQTEFGIIIEGSSADVKLSIDGVLEVTKTTNRPTAACQPYYYIQSRTTAAIKEYFSRYCEIYNKGTTPLVESVYELFNELTTVAKQHFWEWFSGSDLRSIWTKTEVVGTATFAMNDSVNDGFRITADGGANREGMINFNNKRQYAHDNAIFISVMKDVQNTAYTAYSGFADSLVGVNGDSPEIAQVYNFSVNTNKGLRTGDATTKSTTESSVALDTVFTTYKIENGSADIKLTINGVLEVTKTTNRPTVKLQPVCGVFGNAKSVDIRYLEARNT